MFTPKLETERLLLRQIKTEDVDAIFNCWMQDEDASRYMYWKASGIATETLRKLKKLLVKVAL